MTRKAPKQPNVLLIWTDEQRADSLGCSGNGAIRTPNLDRLSSRATLFETAYCCQPVCTPSRGCIMTGLWPHAHGARGNNLPLSPDAPTIAERLGDAYHRGYHGKWHLGDEIKRQRGFDDWVSIEDGIYREFYSDPSLLENRSDYHHYLWQNGFPPDVRTPDPNVRLYSRNYSAVMSYQFTKAGFLEKTATRFLREHDRSRPFFLSVNYLEPHMPFFGPFNDRYDPASLPVGPAFGKAPPENASLRNRVMSAKYNGRDFGAMPLKCDADWRRMRANYYGLVEMVDHSVGGILRALEESGMADDTIIVYTSDHGDMMGDHAMLAKSVMYQESIRIPLMVHVPWLHDAPHRVRGPFSHIDLLPTLMDLMEKPLNGRVHGQSRAGLIRDRAAQTGTDSVSIWHGREPLKTDLVDMTPEQAEAFAHQEWRTLVSQEGWKINLSNADPQQELYNLNDDPFEMNNRFDDPSCRGIRDELTARVRAWQESVGDPVAIV